MEFEEITRRIIGCAYKVYNAMGFGFLESVYEKCMALELRQADLGVQMHTPVPVRYQGRGVGDFAVDLLVEEKVIVELKSVQRLNQAHEVQLVNYLVATGLPVGLLINFGEDKVDVRRKVRVLPDGSSPSIHPVIPSPLSIP